MVPSVSTNKFQPQKVTLKVSGDLPIDTEVAFVKLN